MVKHTIYCMPSRILKKMRGTAVRTWTTGDEFAFMVFGNRERKTSIITGVIRRGTPKGTDVVFTSVRRAILMFHTHPPRHTTLPSIGDIGWLAWFYELHKPFDTFEGFAIGLPVATDFGFVTFYMVTDWGMLLKTAEEVTSAIAKYVEYLEGKVPQVPKEAYDAHEYLWRRLHLFTDRRTMRYTPEIYVEPDAEVRPAPPVEYMWSDLVRTVELMGRFPEMEILRLRRWK